MDLYEKLLPWKHKDKKIKMNLKLELILINTAIIVALLTISTFIAINKSTTQISKISEDVKLGMEKTLDEKLTKAAGISLNILKTKSDTLLNEGRLMGNTLDAINLIEFGMARKGRMTERSFKEDEKNKKKFFLEFKKTNSTLNFIRLASDLQKKVYGTSTGDVPQKVEIINSEGKVKGKSKGLVKSFREENNSELVQSILKTPSGIELTNIISTEDGLAIKAYAKVNKESESQFQKGIIVLTLAIDTSFADELSNITDAQISIYNNEKFLTGTIFSAKTNKPQKMLDEKKIFEALKKGEPKIIKERIIETFERVKEEIKTDNKKGKNKSNIKTTDDKSKKVKFVSEMIPYRVCFVPIKNAKEEIIGMLAVSSKSKDLKDAVAKYEEQKSETARNLIIWMSMISLFGVAVGIFSIFIYAGKLSSEIGKIVTGVNRLGEGDLTKTLNVKSKNEIGYLAHNVNMFIQKLRNTISHIKEGAILIETSTVKIAASNETLSQKTYDQAAALEETMNIMENINEIVIENGEKKKEVEKNAKATKGKIEVLEKTSKELKDSMNLINDSSKEISKIIILIEEITFQTNLLALNAAVEAARAGEYGRGFAVVAQEIRNLAKKTKSAANDIKLLINESGKRVDNGNLLVESTLDNLGSIVSEMNQINELIIYISKGTEQQTTGIEEINKAVKSSEEVASMNAKIAEDTLEHSKTLLEEAKYFLKETEYFVFEDELELNGDDHRKIQEMKEVNN